MKKKVLVLVNHIVGVYNHRRELLEELISEGYEVFISAPQNDDLKKIEELQSLGCKYIETDISRHGTNPFEELKLLIEYNKLMNSLKPDVVLGYSIKPNIYGGIIAKKNNIPFIANVTGLGTVFEKESIVKKVVILLYKIAFSNVKTVFFQNKSNMEIFSNFNIATGKHKLLPGSGVNLSHYKLLKYPDDKKINFVMIARITEEKGINEYLDTAKYIFKRHDNVKFHICGFLDGNYNEIIKNYEQAGIVEYHGMIQDIRTVLKDIHCTIHPSYHEGLSNVLLESAACGRPVLASNIPGCSETFDEGITGLGFKSKNSESLIEAVENFLKLTHTERQQMGLAGRKKMEREFDRQIVVKKYLKEIENITEGN